MRHCLQVGEYVKTLRAFSRQMLVKVLSKNTRSIPISLVYFKPNMDAEQSMPSYFYALLELAILLPFFVLVLEILCDRLGH